MSPFLSDALIAFTAASSARPAAAFEISACRAIASIISDLFTNAPPWQASARKRPHASHVRRRAAPRRTSLPSGAGQPRTQARLAPTDPFPLFARSMLDDGSAVVRRCRGRHGLFGLVLFFGQRHRLRFERLFQDLLDPAHRMDV